MSEEEDIEWEYEDESDAAVDVDAPPEPTTRDVSDTNVEAEQEDEFQYSPNDDDDDDDNVEWEDAVEPTSPHTDTTEQTVEDLNAVKWDYINNVLQREAEENEQNAKPKRTVLRMTKEDKAHELTLHKTHLLLLLATQLRLNGLCQSRVVRGLLLSLTSDSSLDFFAELDAKPLKYALELLVRWFHDHFRLNDNENAAVSTDLTETRLLRVICDRHGHPTELVLLFTALCRVIGLNTRLVVALDPIVVQQHSKAAELALTTASSPAKRKRKWSRKATKNDDTENESTMSSRLPRAWSEVLNPTTKNWIVVDVVHKVVNSTQDIGARRGKFLPLSYVVGVEEEGYVVDVSPRYVDRWSKAMPRRLADDWLIRSLSLINNRLDSSDADTDMIAIREAERVKLRQLIEAEEMPTSFEAFKKHHVYCLERNLGRFECVYPRKAVGLFKGHAVFLRKSVQTTRSWFQWRRLGRQVREDEKDRPAKRLSRGKQSAITASDDDDNGGGDGQDSDRTNGAGLALYGFWQTQEIVPPRVDGATVPKNKFGNIELWSPAHLPIGAVHLQLPRIDMVAEQLGVDFAPAVVGFESRNGVNCPQFDGIVVVEAVAEALLDAHAHVQQSMIEKAINKNQQLIVKRWERLVKRLILKQRLNEEYGKV